MLTGNEGIHPEGNGEDGMSCGNPATCHGVTVSGANRDVTTRSSGTNRLDSSFSLHQSSRETAAAQSLIHPCHSIPVPSTFARSSHALPSTSQKGHFETGMDSFLASGGGGGPVTSDSSTKSSGVLPSSLDSEANCRATASFQFSFSQQFNYIAGLPFWGPLHTGKGHVNTTPSSTSAASAAGAPLTFMMLDGAHRKEGSRRGKNVSVGSKGNDDLRDIIVPDEESDAEGGSAQVVNLSTSSGAQSSKFSRHSHILHNQLGISLASLTSPHNTIYQHPHHHHVFPKRIKSFTIEELLKPDNCANIINNNNAERDKSSKLKSSRLELEAGEVRSDNKYQLA